MASTAQTVTLLLGAGRLNPRNTNSSTPLDSASAVRALAQAGARPNTICWHIAVYSSSPSTTYTTPPPWERGMSTAGGVDYCFALHVWIHCCASAARAAGVSATGGLLPVEEATACAPSPPSP